MGEDATKKLLDEEAAVSDGEVEERVDHKKNTNALLISFIAMVVIGLGNKIFQPLQFIPMYNYPIFTNLLTTFVYIPASFAYIIPMVRWGSLITKEAQDVPKYKFLVMGTLDSTAGIMQSLAVNYVQNGGLVILLSQAAIPMSMIITKIFLKQKYKISQYAGAVIVTAFLLVVLIPFFQDPNSKSGNNTVLWSGIMVLSCIPMTLSSVYKEKALGDADIDPVYLNGWVAFFQFLFAIPLLFPAAAAAKVPIHDIPENLWDGAKCFVGINSIMTGPHPDNCALSPVFVSIYLSFNIVYNVLIIFILKYGSSNILWLAMTVMVPMGNAAFALKFVPNHRAMHVTDIVGLVGIMTGLFVYRFWSSGRHWLQRLRKVPEDEEEEEANDYMSTPARGGGPAMHSTGRGRPRAPSYPPPRGRAMKSVLKD